MEKRQWGSRSCHLLCGGACDEGLSDQEHSTFMRFPSHLNHKNSFFSFLHEKRDLAKQQKTIFYFKLVQKE
jgi:hypothetical protein